MSNYPTSEGLDVTELPYIGNKPLAQSFKEIFGEPNATDKERPGKSEAQPVRR